MYTDVDRVTIGKNAEIHEFLAYGTYERMLRYPCEHFVFTLLELCHAL